MADPVTRVLTAKHYFDVLELPAPTWDALGRASWAHHDRVGAAFRRLSFALHPDRTTHADAPRAFQILLRARKTLDDPSEREVYVKRFVEDQLVRPENSTWVADKSATERLSAQLQRDQQVKELRREDARAHQDLILEQARQRRLHAESKRKLALGRDVAAGDAGHKRARAGAGGSSADASRRQAAGGAGARERTRARVAEDNSEGESESDGEAPADGRRAAVGRRPPVGALGAGSRKPGGGGLLGGTAAARKAGPRRAFM